MAKENETLVNRWLEKMNSEAEKMNEANQFYQSAVSMSRRATLESKAEIEAAKMSATPGEVSSLDRMHGYQVLYFNFKI